MKNTLFLTTFFLLSLAISAQNITIKGKVTDEINLPLPGATVQVKGITKGVETDFDGNYTINLTPDEKTLIYKFIGYEDFEVSIGKDKVINVKLKPKMELLQDVVVIGYAEVKKSDVTGSISSLKVTDVNRNQAQGIENLLQGRVAGAVISQSSFEPTSGVNIQIRGVNSLGMGTQPLYVVDGVIINSAGEEVADPLQGGNSFLSTQNGLSGINPRDIESIEILKDASATAIYGSRASNGVVIITTKKGKVGKPVFNYNGTTRVGKIVRPIEVLDGVGYATYNNESRRLKGFPENYIINNNNVTNLAGNQLSQINWSDEIYQESFSQSHRFSVSGGNDKSTYYMALGHVENKGIVPNSFSKITDFTVNNVKELSNKLTISSKAAFSVIRNSASKGTEFLGGSDNNMSRQILASVPFQNSTDNLISGVDPEDAIDGPRAWIADYDDLAIEKRAIGSLKIEYKINDIFTYRALAGIDYRLKERKLWYGTSLFRGAQVNGEAGVSNFDRYRYNIDNTLSFNKKFGNNHKLNGTVGFVFEQLDLTNKSATASDFPIKNLRADGISNGQVISPLRLTRFRESLASFLGRVNYSLYNRYNFTGTLRADGSSKFLTGNQWGYFPSLAFAWQINKEKFLKNVKTVNEAKLRLGWGTTGNQNTPPYQFISNFAAGELSYPGPEGPELSLIPINLGNSKLTWETTYQTNIGLDLSFFEKRFNTSIEFYNKQTTDLLQRLPIPPNSGYQSILANIGDLQNRGFEFTFNADIIKNDKVKWNVFGNFSMYRNKITKLGLSPSNFGNLNNIVAYAGGQISGGNYFKTYANIFAEGSPAGLYFGYQTNGIITNNQQLAQAAVVNGVAPKLGDIFIIDQNGDGNINDSDKTIIGDPNPDFTYGFGTSLDYKNFNISVLFNGVFGNQIANGNAARLSYADGSSQNITQHAYYSAWNENSNPNGTEPRVNYDLNQFLGFTDKMVEDGSFLRLQNVSIGYKFNMSSDSFLKSLDVSVLGNNLLLFTKYSGYDPEVDSFSGDPLRVGIDWSSFPNQRSFSLNLNLTF